MGLVLPLSSEMVRQLTEQGHSVSEEPMPWRRLVVCWVEDRAFYWRQRVALWLAPWLSNEDDL